MKKKLRYISDMLRILWSSDKRFFVTTMLEILVFSTLPFLQLAFTEKTITMLTNASDYPRYIWTVLVLLLCICVYQLVNIHVNTINNIKGNLLGQKLYTKIFEKCLCMDFEKLQRKETQDKRVMATKAFEGGALATLVMHFKNIVSNLIVAVGVISIAIQADWIILLAVVLIVAMCSVRIMMEKRYQYNLEQEIAPINRKLEYFIGMCSDMSVAKEVRLFHTERSLLEKYDSLYCKTLAALKRNFSFGRKNKIIFEILNESLEIAIYAILGYHVIVIQEMDIAEFSMLALAVRTMKSSMLELITSYGEIEKNAMYLKDYFEFINIPDEFRRRVNCEGVEPLNVIRFENVSFRYPGTETDALKHINIEIREGEKLSIVGENGSGKTTFVKLLMRLYDPTEGKITYNGVDIRELPYQEYLSSFSAVFQDFKIYAFTILENITMFEDVPEEKIDSVLDDLNLLEKIRSLPEQMKTYLTRIYDENGVELSGGQNQKLAIARALVRNAPIYILDEPTAALDPRAESEIFDEFNSMVNGKTAVYISHRLSNCRCSDEIIVLENGTLIEHGTHRELLERCGRYSELFNMQAQYYID